MRRCTGSATSGVAGASTKSKANAAAKFSAAHTIGGAIPAGLAEAIADAANVGERRRARAVELRAKTREVRLEPLGVGVALFRPARAEQRAAIHDLTRAGRERGEQPELGRRQIERLARDGRLMRARIDRELSDRGRGPRARRGNGATQQGAHARGELLLREGLLEVVVGAEVKEPRALVAAFLAGEHEDRRRRRGANAPADLVAGELGEAAIEDDEVRRLFGVPPQGRLAVVRGDHLVAILSEERRHHADHRALVVDDQDARHARASVASGTLNANTPPPPAFSSYQMSPPCASTTRRDAKRPMPDPGSSACAAARTYGSKIRARSCDATPGPSSSTRTTPRSRRRSTLTLILVSSGAYFVALCTRPASTSAVRRRSPRTQIAAPSRGPASRCRRAIGASSLSVTIAVARRSNLARRSVRSGCSTRTPVRIRSTSWSRRTTCATASSIGILRLPFFSASRSR